VLGGRYSPGDTIRVDINPEGEGLSIGPVVQAVTP